MKKVIKILDHTAAALHREKEDRQVKYEVSGVVESYKETGEVHVIVQVKGTAKTFIKSVKELYTRLWLNQFLTEDVAHISFLYAVEQSGNLPLVEYFPRRKREVTKSVIILGMLFVTFLLISNLTAFKLVELDLLKFFFINSEGSFPVVFPAALLFFPMTYFFDDALTEVYGFKISRLIIWFGLFCNTLFTFLTWATVYLPVASIWGDNVQNGESAYAMVLTGSIGIFLASALGYFFGEFANSTVLAKVKILTSGRYLFLRIIGSSAVGVGIDSVIFCQLAFGFILPQTVVWKIVITQYVFKLSYEILMLPLTYLLTALLKKIDRVDHYDFNTKFNPFSFSLEK